MSIDTIGCQTVIVDKIIEAQANYFLAVKQNQGSLYDQVSDDFTWASSKEDSQNWAYDHGRYEERKCQIVSAQEVLSPNLLDTWREIKTVIKIEAQRTIKDVSSSQTRYYISSEEKEAALYNTEIRGYWSIENQLHWHLDVTFNEDANRSRSGNGKTQF